MAQAWHHCKTIVFFRISFHKFWCDNVGRTITTKKNFRWWGRFTNLLVEYNIFSRFWKLFGWSKTGSAIRTIGHVSLFFIWPTSPANSSVSMLAAKIFRPVVPCTRTTDDLQTSHFRFIKDLYNILHSSLVQILTCLFSKSATRSPILSFPFRAVFKMRCKK